MNISLIPAENIPPPCFLSKAAEVISVLPRDICVLPGDPDALTIAVPTNIDVDGCTLLKTVTIKDNGTWSLSVRGKQVDLLKAGLEGKIALERNAILGLLEVVKKLALCEGVEGLKCTIQQHKLVHDNNTKTVTWSKTCTGVLKNGQKSHSCRTCQKFQKYKNKTENRSDESEEHSSDSEPDNSSDSEPDTNISLEAMLQQAPANMKELIKSQIAAIECQSPFARRWSQEMISWCMSIWTRSPKGYEQLKDNGHLILPSSRLLSQYKNRVRQTAGINPDNMRWMLQSAQKIKLPEFGYCGGIVHDEIHIEQDLVMVNTGEDGAHLVGYADLPKECMDIHALQANEIKQELATDVLQINFQGA